MSVMSISVLLADDHLVVLRGLRALLEADPGIRVVGEVSDGSRVVEAIEQLQPNVLVLDLMMPGLSGLDVLKLVAARGLSTRIVVLSMHANEAYVVEALRRGALAYVVKDASGSDLLQAVKQAAAGTRFVGAPFSEEQIEAYLERADASARDPYDALTTREREVLLLAAQGRTSREIGQRLDISRRTAETHRANLMRKLGLKGQQDLLRYALRRGLLGL